VQHCSNSQHVPKVFRDMLSQITEDSQDTAEPSFLREKLISRHEEHENVSPVRAGLVPKTPSPHCMHWISMVLYQPL